MAQRRKCRIRITTNAVLALLLAVVLLVGARPARAHGPDDGKPEGEAGADGLPPILENAKFDQKLGQQAPFDTRFLDATGQPVQLGDFFKDDKPVLLTMNYYECDTLCPLVLDGVVRGLNGVAFKIGDEFNVVTVSIDPTEGPTEAADLKRRIVDRYGHGDAAERWAFLTGDHEQIDLLAAALGVNFAYDEEIDEYAHPSGAIILTPDGTISRYLYGIEFNPRDLRLALVEASEGRIGTVVDDVMLFCYRYDPTAGQYTPLAFNMMKVAGAVTLIAIAGVIGPMMVRDVRHGRLRTTGGAS